MPRAAQPCVDGPGPCPCRFHASALAAQRRHRRRKGRPAQFNQWLASHDALLVDRLTHGDTPEQIAVCLTDRFSVPRTAVAVKLRITRLGRSLRDGWLTESDLIRRLGLTRPTLRSLEAQGSLIGTTYGRWRRYLLTDVVRFVVTSAGTILDPRRVRDPRLRSLAETSATVNIRRAG